MIVKFNPRRIAAVQQIMFYPETKVKIPKAINLLILRAGPEFGMFLITIRREPGILAAQFNCQSKALVFTVVPSIIIYEKIKVKPSANQTKTAFFR